MAYYIEYIDAVWCQRDQEYTAHCAQGQVFWGLSHYTSGHIIYYSYTNNCYMKCLIAKVRYPPTADLTFSQMVSKNKTEILSSKLMICSVYDLNWTHCLAMTAVSLKFAYLSVDVFEGCIDSYIDILAEKSMTKLLKSVYARIHDLPEDDPDLQNFFRSRCWIWWSC